MNSVRKALLAIVATVALAGSLAGCADGGNTTIDEPIDTLIRTETTALIYTNTSDVITKYVDAGGNVRFEEGYTSKDTEIKSPDYAYYQSDPIILDDTIEIEGTTYPISTELYIDFQMSTAEMIPAYNEIVAPNVATAPTPFFLNDPSIQEVFARYVRDDISRAINNGELPKVQLTPSGKATVVTDADIAQAKRDGVSAREAYARFISETTYDSSRYFYSNYCGTYGVQRDSAELTTALAVRFPNVGATFIVSTNETTINIETAEPCTIVSIGESQSNNQNQSYNSGDDLFYSEYYN